MDERAKEDGCERDDPKKQDQATDDWTEAHCKHCGGGRIPWSAYGEGDCAAATQRRHRQARLRWDSGNDARAEALTVTSVHQHGVSKLPEHAGAHSFGAPQTGHAMLGSGSTIASGVRKLLMLRQAVGDFVPGRF
jgi:hypothetical protein